MSPIFEKLIFLILPNSIISKAILIFFKRWGVHILSFLLISVLTIFLLFIDKTTVSGNSYGFIPLPNSLVNYIEKDFSDTDTPKYSPLGGKSMLFSIITANYLDPEYLKEFGFQHDGLDLVPSSQYFKNSLAYKLTGEVIVIATMSGKACSSGDISKGFRIEIYSKDNLYYTTYLHNKFNFIELNSCKNVIAGEPIAVMGQTGFATGAHIHYMVHKNLNGNWIEENPINYL